MGVVMMTGIMAIFEMGLSLKGKSLLLKPNDTYQQNLKTNAVGLRDKQMLNILHTQSDLNAIGKSLQRSALCDELLCRADATPCPIGKFAASDAGSRLPHLSNMLQGKTPDAKGPFSNACALADGSHRLLIRLDPAPVNTAIPYQLFSCVLSGGSEACDFESSR